MPLVQQVSVSDEMVEAAHRYICGIYPYPQSKPETRQMLQEAWNVAALSAAEPTLWVSPVDLRAWRKAKAGEIWAWSENLEGECIPLYAAPPAPSVAVKAAMTDDEIYHWIDVCNHEPARETLRHYLALRCALSAQVQDVAGWQPIETAPKDGSEFQAFIINYGWEPRARFNPETVAFEIWGRVDYDQDGWDFYPHMVPSHWMPLPAAPAKQEGDE